VATDVTVTAYLIGDFETFYTIIWINLFGDFYAGKRCDSPSVAPLVPNLPKACRSSESPAPSDRGEVPGPHEQQAAMACEFEGLNGPATLDLQEFGAIP
jgi:hypothetical protein